MARCLTNSKIEMVLRKEARMGTTGPSEKMGKRSHGSGKRYRFLRNLVFLAVMVSMFSVPLVAAPPVLAAPAVGISDISGTPGSAVNISGTDFTVGDSYSIVFGPTTAYEQTLVSSVVIASGTTFSQPIIIPQAPWAQFTIRVDTNRGSFNLTFQVTPNITTHITTGYVNDTVIVNGAGFRAGAGVNILFNNTSIVTTNSDTFGTLPTVTFQVPALRSGTYAVYGSDTLASSPSVFFVLLTHLTASVIEGAVGDHVTLTGSGFEYNSPLTFYWDGQTVSSIQISSSSTGNFTTDFVIPPGARGTHSIKVVDNSARQANVIFSVNPSLALDPANGFAGNVVTVTGKGFRYNATIAITFRGSTIATQPSVVTTDVYGGFSATFILPSVTAGSYAVRASDDANAVTATLNVILKIELSPSAGNVGTVLQVKGSGFTPSGSISLSYDGQVITTVNTDTAGSFTATFTVPASKAGAHSISATDLVTPGLVTTATFTMESTPPAKPNLLTPAPGSQASISPTFVWSGVSDPSGVTYSLQVARDAAFSQMLLDKQGLTTPDYAVTPAEAFGLTKATSPYFWRVKASDGAGNDSDWTAAGTFYTQDSTPPALPLLLSPQSDSQADVRPAFSWSAVTDPSGVTYTLQVARDAGFSSLVLMKQGLDASNYQAAPAEELELSKRTTPYYWRVKASDGAGNESGWSSPGTFYTQDSTPPPAPTALRPGQGSQQGSETFFDWTDTADPSGVTYTLQVAQDSAFSRVLVVKEGLKTSEYKLSKQEKLSSSTANTPDTYYWRVKASDGAGNESNWSTSNEFQVRGFLQSGWPVYLAIGIGGLLLLALGVFIGMHLKPQAPVKETDNP
jgi:hypothetical protein